MTDSSNRRGLPTGNPRRFAVIGVVALLGLVLAVGYLLAMGRLGDLRARFAAVDIQATTQAGPPSWLIVGLDDRAALSPEAAEAEPGARADIILLATQTPQGLRLTSIPRDLRVPMIQSRMGLLDDRLAIGWLHSPQQLLTSLCRGTGIGVDHVVAFDFRSFGTLVDSLDGIDVHLDYPLRDADQFDWSAGTLHLNGEDALKFVRSRQAEAFIDGHWQPEPNGAVMRQRRSAQAFSAVLSRSKREPRAAFRGLWDAAPDIQLDAGATWSDFLPLAAASGAPTLLPAQTLDPINARVTDDTRRYVADLGYRSCRA